MDIFYFLISFLSSIIGSISGIGGGVIIKPTLDTLSGLDVATIGFLSGNTVLAMTTVTLLRGKSCSVKIDKRVSSLLAIGGIIGGVIGKYIFDIFNTSYNNSNLIEASQSIILGLLTFGVLLFTIYKKKIKPCHIKSNIITIIIGLTLGAIASFLGIGGGPINLALLYLFFSMDSKKAALNSIFIIFCSQFTNLIFTIITGSIPEVSPQILIFMIVGGITGGLLGSYITSKVTNSHVDKIFSTVLLIIIGLTIYNVIS